ncbi:MAG: 2-dehydro-3-deoxygalactonokinase [Sciscionella sp.]
MARVQTYFTGELFDLLCRHSSPLRTGAGAATEEGGLRSGLTRWRAGDLAASLFQTRTAQLIEGRPAGWARAFLSGLLIGAEIGSMAGMRVLASEPLTVIGDPELTARYLRVLAGLRVLADAERHS